MQTYTDAFIFWKVLPNLLRNGQVHAVDDVAHIFKREARPVIGNDELQKTNLPQVLDCYRYFLFCKFDRVWQQVAKYLLESEFVADDFLWTELVYVELELEPAIYQIHVIAQDNFI